jgi:hypothetical protein
MSAWQGRVVRADCLVVVATVYPRCIQTIVIQLGSVRNCRGVLVADEYECIRVPAAGVSVRVVTREEGVVGGDTPTNT